ncbi:HNH endonuclease signature motif containing protein [Actinomadura sp. NAK00032]|uniref:HNH endonuclease signature motif containing protein n=1 Tax=Actinomadura sp. NAK00032 TaxID=2742128 RepID=UPI0020C74880|nr:HNH endonuclease signature motif containing protein [Actinomadura sp. NAK00032]
MSAQVAEIGGGQREWEDRVWFPPGPQLAVCLSGSKERLADLTDDELLQVAAAARRQTSWAQARELAAIAELTRRRTSDEDCGAEESGDPEYRVLSARESVAEEVAVALSVTGNAAATLVHLAEQLTGPLARTGEALGAGRVDMAKARVICDVTEGLPGDVAGKVQCVALEKASEQTTGQLRRRIKRIAQRLAPQAIEERKRGAVRHRRLELWDTPSGTSDLALCDLAAEDAHAIFNKITAAANGIKADGDPRPLSTLRADLATALLHGVELPEAVRTLLSRTGDESDVASPSADGGEAVCARLDDDVDERLGGLAGEVERRLNHVRGRVRPRELPHAIRQAARHIDDQLADARDTACQGDEECHGSPDYRPPAAMRREIEARHSRCVFPTCNQPSRRCDLDHTIPWRPGLTCRCNLAPLCRRHHRLKQTAGWRLHQIWPGLLIWITPSGGWYIVRPDRQ